MLLFLVAIIKNKHITFLIFLLSTCAFASTAKVKPYICSEQHSADGYDEPIVWRCAGQMPLWSYNCEIDECVEFHYGGCGGSDNSFYTKEECEDTFPDCQRIMSIKALNAVAIEKYGALHDICIQENLELI